MNSEWNLRREIVRYAHRAYEKGLVAATDGNISCRLSGDRVLVTPSGCCLGDVGEADLVIVDPAGRLLSGRGKATSELAAHLAVYARRPDVTAVVHAHPPIANAFSFAGVELDRCVIPEVVVGLGVIPTTEYGTPASEEGARVIAGLIHSHDALLLQRHGSLTVGADVRAAYFKLEKLEHAAVTLLAARMLGGPIALSPEEVARLAHVSQQRGWRPAEEIVRACSRRE